MATLTRPARKRRTVTKTRKAPAKKKVRASDIAASYNQFKEFGGKQYTGMQVGRSHKWYYDKGEWKETKITPDLWRIFYAVTKRRAGKAPRGSGVPVGTGYHWYILAHQNVVKLNANDYTTSLMGLKYKLAHKRADKEKWATSAATQRKHLVAFLKEWIEELEREPLEIEFDYKDKTFKGEAVRIPEACDNGVCTQWDINLNNESFGIIHARKTGWKMEQTKDEKFAKAIGEAIEGSSGKSITNKKS